MIPKREIIDALQGTTIAEMTIGELSLQIKGQIAELAIRAGEHKTEQFIYDTALLLAKTLKSDYSRLYLLEIILSIDFCGRGLTIEIKGISVLSIISALKFYLNSEERKTAKAELENKAVALLPEKTQWTDEDYLSSMRKRYRENMQRVRNGSTPVDLGGLLFHHMHKLELIEILPIDYQQVTDSLLAKKKANPFDIEVRRCLNSDEIKKIMARENAMNRYFKMEVELSSPLH